VTAQDVRLRCCGALRKFEACVQSFDPSLRLWMTARRMQTREIAVAYELDRRTASSVSSSVPVRARPIR